MSIENGSSNGCAGQHAFEFKLNGETTSVEGVSSNTTLLDFLRMRGFRGTKEGCAEGDCGACAVAIVERDAHGQPCYRSVNSCLMLLPMAAGREVVTVEGVQAHAPRAAAETVPLAGEDEHHHGLGRVTHGGTGHVPHHDHGRSPADPMTLLHPVQRCMVERNGSQCGYCTPGFIASMFETYHRHDLRERWQISDALCGNLCRCTGYRPIADAMLAALAERGSQIPPVPDAPPLPTMDYLAGKHRFLQPTRLTDLLSLRARLPHATLVGGATELGLDVNKKFYRFKTLISVAAVPELGRIERTDAGWSFGAAASLTRLEETLRADLGACPDSPLAAANTALLKMLGLFGSRPIRNRATLGGNLINASPIGDLAPVLLALDASVVLQSEAAGERIVRLDNFFVSYRKTALRPDEVLCAVRVPPPRSAASTLKNGAARNGSTHLNGRGKAPRVLIDTFKVSRRREMDISAVAAAYQVVIDADNHVVDARLAYGGVASTTIRARRTEAALCGQPWSRETLATVLPVLAEELTPITDVRASADYRRGLITGLLQKFFDLDGQPDTPALDRRPLGAPPPLVPNAPGAHESAVSHVTGSARYVDDYRPPLGQLEAWPVCSPHARARILRRDAAAARRMPGVRLILMAEDVPGENNVGAGRKDEIFLADKDVFFHGQLVAVVIGDSLEACRLAAAAVVVEYEPLPPILTVPEAIAAESFLMAPNSIRRGDVDTELARLRATAGTDDGPGALTLRGEFAFGGQEHFYLESHVSWADPGEDGTVFLQSSTQHPSEIQAVVSHLLHIPKHKVVVQSPRMGGGFGGKETQGAAWACIAALAAWRTRRPVRVRLNRDQDMALTGKRHPFHAWYEVGFERDGTLRAVRVKFFPNGGWSLDLTAAITEAALLNLVNSYYIPHVDFCGRGVKTNLVSNTAFRGFGGPQGMLMMEEIIHRVASHLGLLPEDVREHNLYHGTGETNTTHYGQNIGDNRLQDIWHTHRKATGFDARREEIRAWNAAQTHRRRGLAMTPLTYGISFTLGHYNQAGAHVLIYQDGSVQVNHGGTEMGQGLHTKMLTVAARELGLPLAQVRVMHTRTDQVPNTSPTAASSGSDLNGQAVRAACVTLRDRLARVAAECLGEGPEAAAQIVFADGKVFHPAHPARAFDFSDITTKAYTSQISLAATGFYGMPGIKFDSVTGRGTPFFYFVCSAVVSEVEVDRVTGAHHVRRVDILHDVGRSINENVDRGQIEGGFIQGMGWLTCEELSWDKEGRLLTHAPSTYKIPAFGDTPPDFRVSLLPNASEDKVIHGSKGVGEPPFLLALSVREAIRAAVGAFGTGEETVALASPATNEAIYLAIQRMETPSLHASASRHAEPAGQGKTPLMASTN